MTKSRTNRWIDGICGGVAEYFDVDPTIVRIIWILISLSGAGFLLYIAAMIIMPAPAPAAEAVPPAQTGTRFDKKRFWGVLLILLGAFILMSNLGLMTEFWWWSFSGKVVFPILLIAVGLVLMIAHSRRSALPDTDTAGASPETVFAPRPRRELRRSITDRKLFGVCGGIAAYLDLDATLIRILYLILVIASFGWGLLLYIIMAILMPEEKPAPAS